MTFTCELFTFIACTTNRNQFGKQFHVYSSTQSQKLSHLNPPTSKTQVRELQSDVWLPQLLPELPWSLVASVAAPVSPVTFSCLLLINFSYLISWCANFICCQTTHSYVDIHEYYDSFPPPSPFPFLHLPQPTTFCHNFWYCCCLAEAKQKAKLTTTTTSSWCQVFYWPSYARVSSQLGFKNLFAPLSKFCPLIIVSSAFSQLDCTHVCSVV